MTEAHDTAQHRPSPNQRVSVACMFIALVVITSLGVIHVGRRHEVVRKGYELTTAQATLRQHQEDNRRLKLERSVLTAPARIERLAEAMGMHRPGAGQVRVVPPVAHARAVPKPRDPAASGRGARP